MISSYITVDETIKIIIVFTLGYYELHIAMKTISTNERTLCKKFSFSDLIKQYHAAIECDKTMLGDIIIVKKTDDGPIRLFEIYPIGKHYYHYSNIVQHEQIFYAKSPNIFSKYCTSPRGSIDSVVFMAFFP